MIRSNDIEIIFHAIADGDIKFVNQCLSEGFDVNKEYNFRDIDEDVRMPIEKLLINKGAHNKG